MNSYDGDEFLRPAEFADFIAAKFPEFFEEDNEEGTKNRGVCD